MPINYCAIRSRKLRDRVVAFKFPKIDGFVWLLLLSIAAAKIASLMGLNLGFLSEVAHWGVSVVFFFYGLKLTPEKFAYGLRNVKLHAVVHISTFVLFPLIVWGVMRVVGADPMSDLLWLGVFFVAALPSTVSSSVVMVSIARGNIAAAIFNASISSLMGVFLTPLIMSLVMAGGNSTETIGLGEMVIKLIFQVIVPIGVGMLLCRRCGAWASRNSLLLRNFDQGVILLIVFTSFCESFDGKMFDGMSWWVILGLSGAMAALFGVVYLIVGLVCKWLRFSRQDRITALFCGSKKSLVHGTVMSNVIFAGSATGVILLPIMIYHTLQLVIVSVIAQKFDKEFNETNN